MISNFKWYLYLEDSNLEYSFLSISFYGWCIHNTMFYMPIPISKFCPSFLASWIYINDPLFMLNSIYKFTSTVILPLKTWHTTIVICNVTTTSVYIYMIYLATSTSTSFFHTPSSSPGKVSPCTTWATETMRPIGPVFDTFFDHCC